jgi:hypothetical protein
VDDILVELDEERHFNRYREQTLRAAVYAQLPAFPRATYQSFCVEHEDDCLTSASFGGYWSNDSCEAMFGKAGPKRDLSGAGAPRWKQRAFYDFLKDLAPLCDLGLMARLAIWDELSGTGGLMLGEVLEGGEFDKSISTSVMRLVYERTTQTRPE